MREAVMCGDHLHDCPELAAQIKRLEESNEALLVALKYWLPDETMIPFGHEAEWHKALKTIAQAPWARQAPLK